MKTNLSDQKKQQKKRLHQKNIAVALGVFALVVIFYALIVVRLHH